MLFPFRDRLSANDLLPVRKILEHVVEKILKPESTSSSQHDQYGGGATSANSSGGGTNSTSGGNHPSGNTHGGMTVEELNDAVDAIELICNDVVRLKYLIVGSFCSKIDRRSFVEIRFSNFCC